MKPVTWDDYKKKRKLPAQWRSKLALLLISNKLLIGIVIYALIFFIWPIFSGPDPASIP